MPADLTQTEISAIQTLAKRAYQCIDGRGMARVDCFLKPDGRLLINEINTIPGFTDISLYPRMWQASGLDYPALAEKLIDLGLAEHRAKTALVKGEG